MKLSSSALLVVALGFSSSGIASASEPEITANSGIFRAIEYPAFQELNEEQLIEAFSVIEAIPDEILAKDDPQALREWYSFLGQDRVNWIACGSAIGLAIVTNFTPAKIIKIKSAIKTVGGAVTFTKKVYSVYKKARASGLTKKLP